MSGFPHGTGDKEPPCQCRRHRRRGFDSWVKKIPRRRKWQPTPVSLPGESLGQRSLAGYSPWGGKESDTTERLSTQSRQMFVATCFHGPFLSGHVDRETRGFPFQSVKPKFYLLLALKSQANSSLLSRGQHKNMFNISNHQGNANQNPP